MTVNVIKSIPRTYPPKQKLTWMEYEWRLPIKRLLVMASALTFGLSWAFTYAVVIMAVGQ